MTPRIRTLLVRAPLASLIAAVLLAAFSTPAPARPTTPCDESPGCATPKNRDEGGGRDSGGGRDEGSRPDGKVEQRRGCSAPSCDDDDGGQDSGGW